MVWLFKDEDFKLDQYQFYLCDPNTGQCQILPDQAKAQRDFKLQAQKFLCHQTAVVFLIANLDPATSANFYQKTNQVLNNQKPHFPPHISLFSFLINSNHPNVGIFTGPEFQSTVKQAFNNHLKSLNLYSEKGNYELLGGNFFARKYRYGTKDNDTSQQDKKKITDFRMAIYRFLISKLGRSKRQVTTHRGQKYFVYSYQGEPLIAILDYHHGKGNWVPHISMVNMRDIQQHNPTLHQAISSASDKNTKKNLIQVEIQKAPDSPISIIQMDKINQIKLSITPPVKKDLIINI